MPDKKIDISSFDEPVDNKIGGIDISGFDEPVKKKSSSGYSVTPLPSRDKFDIGEEVSTIGYKSPIGKAIQKDKIKGSNVAGVYNTLVGSLASISGGFTYMADILGAQPYMPLNVRVATAEADRKKAVDFIEQVKKLSNNKVNLMLPQQKVEA